MKKSFHKMAAVMLAAALATTAVTYSSAARADCTAEQNAAATKARKELQRLNQSTRPGADAQMEKPFLALAATTCELTALDYRKGGVAARANGDIASAIKRFELAQEGQEILTTKGMFGYVNIPSGGTGPAPAPLTAVSANTPSAHPWKRAAFERAVRNLAAVGKFRGYLPPGKYSVGGREFEVKVGETIDVIVP